MLEVISQPKRARACPTCGLESQNRSHPYCGECRKKRLHDEWLKRANAQLPKKYNGASFERIEERGNIAQLKAMLGHAIENHKSVYLYGGVGSGKTRLIAATFMTLASKGVEVRWCNMGDFLDELRDAYKYGGSSREVLNGYYHPAVTGALFIDDLGVEHVTDWVESQVYRLIDRITANEGWMFISSNEDLSGLMNILGQRIASRIAGSCIRQKNSASDYRLMHENESRQAN